MHDSFELGVRIFDSGYRPTFIIGVWRGGTPVGIAIQEVLEICDCPTNHFAIRTSSYSDGMTPGKEVRVYGLQHVADTINADDKLLIVDDVFDSGGSVAAIIDRIKSKCRRNTPADIRVATVYYKPEKNKTDRVPDFYIHEANEWLVFPHELRGCNSRDILTKKPMSIRARELLSQKLN